MDDLTWKPAWQLRGLMASGELSPVVVTDHFLARIEKLDPVLRAFALVAQAMAGPDGRDFDSVQAEPGDYLAGFDAGVEGMRLAWTDDFGCAGRYARWRRARG